MKIEEIKLPFKYTHIVPINAGWSGDENYRMYSQDKSYLLRLSPLDKKEKREFQFELLSEVYKKVSSPRPIDRGTFEKRSIYTVGVG